MEEDELNAKKCDSSVPLFGLVESIFLNFEHVEGNWRLWPGVRRRSRKQLCLIVTQLAAHYGATHDREQNHKQLGASPFF